MTETAVHNELGRILQAYCDFIEIRLHVFNEQREARAWLSGSV